MDAELLVQSLVDYEVASVSQKFLTTMMVHQPISPLWHMRSALQHCWLCDTISDNSHNACTWSLQAQQAVEAVAAAAVDSNSDGQRRSGEGCNGGGTSYPAALPPIVLCGDMNAEPDSSACQACFARSRPSVTPASCGTAICSEHVRLARQSPHKISVVKLSIPDSAR